MYRKNNKSKYMILIIMFTILVIIGLITLIMKDDRKIGRIETFLKDSTFLVGKVVSAPFNFITDKFTEIKEKNDIYDKYQNMKKKYEQTDVYLSKIDELEHIIKELKTLNNIDYTTADYSYLNATVMSRDVGFWYDTITINRGKNNDVKNNMAVITSNGLIGKVVNVTTFTSTVKLLSSNDLNMKISVKIKIDNDYIYGLLTGYDTKSKCYIIEGISYAGEIPVDSVVTTTGMSDVFPSGILVGTVKLVETDNFDLAKIIKVKSEVNYDQLSYVTVLKRDLSD